MEKIIKINETNINEKIDFLAKEIKNGKVVIMPTSTIYGICGNALNENTVKRIYEIKRRAFSKPLIVLVNSRKMLDKITYGLNFTEEKLANKFWPGALTMILKKKETIPDIVTSNKDSVGIRIDSNRIVNNIIEKSNVPIVAPSANISDKENITSISDLDKDIIDLVDYIIDGGNLQNTEESTIVKVEGNQLNILREGKIKKEDIYDCL